MESDHHPRFDKSTHWLAWVAWGVLMAVLNFLCIRDGWAFLQARKWQAAPAVLTHQGVMQGAKGSRARWGRYTYEWQGRQYESEQVHALLLGYWPVSAPAPETGAQVVCFVNPLDPQNACLFRNWPHHITLGFLLGNLGMTWLLLRALRHTRVGTGSQRVSSPNIPAALG